LPHSTEPRARARAALAAAVSAAVGLALGAAAVAAILSVPQPPAAVEPVVRVALPAPPAATPSRVEAAAAPHAPPRATPRRSRDLDCLAEAVYFEARGESRDGQAAVAQVVLNRVRHPAFPNTVCGVVYQGAKGRGCQFSFACDGRPERAEEGAAWRRARRVAARALAGVVVPQIGSATHFHAARVQPNWGPGLRRVAQVGVHVFYKLVPSKGAAPVPPAKTRLAHYVAADHPADHPVDPTDAAPTAAPAEAAAHAAPAVIADATALGAPRSGGGSSSRPLDPLKTGLPSKPTLR
jgi:hypothetical protein